MVRFSFWTSYLIWTLWCRTISSYWWMVAWNNWCEYSHWILAMKVGWSAERKDFNLANLIVSIFHFLDIAKLWDFLYIWPLILPYPKMSSIFQEFVCSIFHLRWKQKAMSERGIIYFWIPNIWVCFLALFLIKVQVNESYQLSVPLWHVNYEVFWTKITLLARMFRLFQRLFDWALNQ